MGRINRTKLLTRQCDRREARLCVIATEGKETEKQYFSLFNSSRIKVEILATGEDGKSAPQYVLERLDEFRKRYDLNQDDMLWLVVDVDRWPIRNLSDVCREAKQKNYGLAISNPCFEVWLCMHLADLDLADQTCKDFGKRLKTILGKYDKANLDLSIYQPLIAEAINRAKNLHPELQNHWPTGIGSHVYRLVEILVQSFQR
jgi:bifunctional DNA-binding transcriptional regulator/antitoxin component of YhaV-PrlF toxin-antitoxin module